MGVNELNILVVEDDNFQRQMIVKMLRSLNMSSICDVGNGKQALEIRDNSQREQESSGYCDLRFEYAGNGWLRVSAVSGSGAP